jgi:hypothetical protein
MEKKVNEQLEGRPVANGSRAEADRKRHDGHAREGKCHVLAYTISCFSED